MNKAPKCLYRYNVNVVKTTDKKDETYDTIPVKLEQKTDTIPVTLK